MTTSQRLAMDDSTWQLFRRLPDKVSVDLSKLNRGLQLSDYETPKKIIH